MIELIDVNKYFGDKHVLKNINLKIEQGEVVALINPSGSGKSTTLRCMNFMERPTSGKVIFEGQTLDKFRYLPPRPFMVVCCFSKP